VGACLMFKELRGKDHYEKLRYLKLWILEERGYRQTLINLGIGRNHCTGNFLFYKKPHAIASDELRDAAII